MPRRPAVSVRLQIVVAAASLLLVGLPTIALAAGPGEADLALDLSAPGSTVAGATAGFDYVITVDNLGDLDNLSGYSATLALPEDVTFGTAPGCTFDLEPNTVTCADGDGITAAETPDAFIVHVTSKSNALGDVVASADVVASNVDTDPDGTNVNDTDTATVNVTAEADLEVTSNVASPTPISANDASSENTTTFTIGVKNNGPSDAQSVILNAGLPSTEFESATSCTGSECTPTDTFTGSLSLETLVAGASETVLIAAVADEALRDGPVSAIVTASLSSDTDDPTPGNESKDSNTVTINTVPNPPTNAHTDSGNTNAVVRWTAPTNDGGSAILGYLVTFTPTTPNTTTTPPEPCTVVTTPAPGATTDRVDSGTNSLKNTCKYDVSVQAENAVGLSDAVLSNTQAEPTRDKSARILTGNDSQTTGNGMTSQTDPVVGKQNGNFQAKSIGFMIEIIGSGLGLDAANFCGGKQCAGNEVILNEVSADTIGRYSVELLYGKQVTFGTGNKAVFFNGDPFNQDPDIVNEVIQLQDCKKAPVGNIACIQKQVTNAQLQNPAVRIVISVRQDVVDPVSGTRK